MTRRWLLLGVFCSACGGSSPTAPAPIVPIPTTPTTITLNGHVTATNGGQPLAGVQASLGAVSAMTDGAGSFTAQMPPTGTLSLSLTGSGIVPRSVSIAAGSSRDLSVDAIALAGFDLGFYRQLVRDANESGSLQPLRRLTKAPSIYLRTVRTDGLAVDAAMLDTVEAVIRDAMPRWSGMNPVAVVRGADLQPRRLGWLTVTWPGPVGADRRCGQSDVGLDGGDIELFVPTAAACGCEGSTRIRPRVVRHELGHAMGFYHTDSPNDVMIASSSACDQPISARELTAAAIAYARPVGNMEPDTDPSGIVNLAPMRIP